MDFKALEKQILAGGSVPVPAFLQDWLKKPKKNFIGGQWVDGAHAHHFPTLNPAREETLSEIAVAEKEDVDLAVAIARKAYERGTWSRLSLKERCEWLKKLGDKILEHRAPLAILETLDTGKPIRESFDGDILRSAHNFHFFADFAQNEKAATYEVGSDTHRTYREPMGVVALITPWNLPLYLETWKIAPALAMGNSVILKPSELTPLTATYLTELIEGLGLPTGVFNLVHGFGENSTGEFLVSHPDVNAISFTGETSTGRAIMRSAASGPTRVSFELGGKGATVVFADASIETAVKESLRAAYRNQGEICLACPRIFVEKSRYQEFLEAFSAGAKAIRPGDPLDYHTQMGALISREHLEKVSHYVKSLEGSAKVAAGGDKAKATGFFLNPTVVIDAQPTHRICREEVFGPVVTILPFSSEDEAVELVNGTQYGLSASIWTNDKQKAERVAKKVRIGLVWINCWFVRDLRVPFGGQKRSGLGREGGSHSLDFYSEWKSVCVRD